MVTSGSPWGGSSTFGRGRVLLAAGSDANSSMINVCIATGSKSPTAITAMRSGRYQSL
jgi:hypothetical protein